MTQQLSVFKHLMNVQAAFGDASCSHLTDVENVNLTKFCVFLGSSGKPQGHSLGPLEIPQYKKWSWLLVIKCHLEIFNMGAHFVEVLWICTLTSLHSLSFFKINIMTLF